MTKIFIKLLNTVAIALCLLLGPGAFAQSKIDLSEGTLFLSGSLAFNYSLIGFSKPQQGFSITSDVGGGYFVADNIAVGLSLPGKWTIAPIGSGEIGLKIFSHYFFDIGGGLFPYAGANLTPGYSMGDKSFQLAAGVDGGILVSLSESIAMDFGLRPELNFKLFDSQKWKLQIPAGFIGIKAVF